MILKGKTDYSKPERREDLAGFLAITIEGSLDCYLPYRPNKWDDYYWTLDNGNNWKVKFYHEEPFWFEIIHRYQGGANRFEEALAGWLEYKLGVERL